MLIGNGDGSYRAKSVLSTGGSIGSATIGDVNSDGILDIVSSNKTSNSVSVFIGNGDGGFKVNANYTCPGHHTQSAALGM